MIRRLNFSIATLAIVFVAFAGIALAAIPVGPAGYWALDEGSGTTALDTSSNANNGTINGGAVYTTIGIAPLAGNDSALTFDGVDDFVSVANSTALDMTAAYSLSMWVNVTDVATYRPILYRGTTNANDIEVYVQSGTGDLIVAHNRGNGGTFDYVGFDNPPVGTLFHLSVVFDGTNVQAYYNGVAATVVQQATAMGTPLDTDKGWMMGKVDHSAYGGSGVFYFSGLLDEVLIYDRALTGAEVTFLATPSTTHLVDDDGIVGSGALDCDGTGFTTFSTIQAAVSAANSGETINVCPGTYTEVGQVVIDKNLSIVGASAATVTLMTLTDTTNAGADTDAWVLVSPGNTFNISQVTLDGTGRTIRDAIRFNGSGSVNGVAFQNIGYNPSINYRGAGVHNASTGNVDITDSTFTNMGRNGVIYNAGGTGIASGNTYTGKGPGNWLDYAFDIEYGSNVTISNNQVSNNLGVASVDSSTSAAISVWDDAGTQAVINGNTLTNNTAGIAVAVASGASDPIVTIGTGNVITGGDVGLDIQSGGAFGSPTVNVTGTTFSGNATGLKVVAGMSVSNMTVNRNTFTGNTSGADNGGTDTLNATCNWWGNASGPGPVGPGSGDTVSANVNFSSWLTTSDLTGPCNGPLTVLTLQKVVAIDNGGTAVDTDWTLSASSTSDTTTISGAEGDAAVTNATVTPGSYDLSESGGPSGYTASSWVCTGGTQLGNTITLATGESATCVITNDDVEPSLTLQKVVVNDNGGSATMADWTVTATGPTGFSGSGPIVANGVSFDAGSYDLSESGPAGYTASAWVCIGGSQTDGDTIVIAPGQNVLCTITNNDNPSPIPPPPANACATPLVAPAGYTLLNGTKASDTVTIAPFTMFVGKGGNDIVNGPASGNYIVCTDKGNDTITLGDGDFTINASNGNNTIVTGNGNGFITTAQANDKVTTGNGTHTINVGSGNNTIVTGDGNQTITTGNAIDKITTGAGSDVINAGGGPNTVKSGGGNDTVTTGSSNDNIDGGSGTDTCNAGGGINTVVNCEL